MEGIKKLMKMFFWFNDQTEFFNEQFKTVSEMEKVFEYASVHSLSHMDFEFLYSGAVTEKERIAAIEFLQEIKKNNSNF